MDEALKPLMAELGEAINQSLADSDRIGAAIHELKKAGYDIYLIIEATIGFNRIKSEGTAETAEPVLDNKGQIRATSFDKKFLTDLKISFGS